MRFFRIPSFTGIEAHRDDADRGSLRMVEGCLPHGPGGLRSGPVWKKVGDVEYIADGDQNKISAGDDGLGNSLIFVSRNNEVHDLALETTEHTELDAISSQYEVTFADPSLYTDGPANITPIGNKLYAVGDGSFESVFVGKGPDSTFEVFPDESLYSQEWSRFPKCQFFVQGPKKTIFAAGNPDKPLTIYISEPAGLTSPYRDTPYSTEDTTYNQGVLSTVNILGSNASKITALSTRGDQVVVHTDKGCHLLYAPAPDQANTGYRVEQAPATNFSAAVNSKVVSRASGALTYWVGHDGQVYKDEAASRGSEDLRSRADEDQANWKSKGVWENELPTDLTRSFAVYSPQTGMYWFFVESEEKKTFDLIPRTPMREPPYEGPTDLLAEVLPPNEGPTDLTAIVLPPNEGPTDLLAEEAPVLAPEEGPTNLIASIDSGGGGGGGEDPSTESKYIVFEIAEDGVYNRGIAFGGWQGDSLGYYDPGGVVKVLEDPPVNYDGLSFLQGNQVIEIGGRNGHVESVYYPGIVVKNDHGYFYENTVYTVSAEANAGWYFKSWDVQYATTTPPNERYPAVGLPRGEVQIISGSLSNPTNLTLKVTDATNYVRVRAEFTDTDPDPDPDPDPDIRYSFVDCDCVSDSSGFYSSYTDCIIYKESSTYTCMNGECVAVTDGSGEYSTCEDCQAGCSQDTGGGGSGGGGSGDPCDSVYLDYNLDCTPAGPDMGVLTECDCTP